MPASRHSHSLARLAAQEAARGSFEAARGDHQPVRAGDPQAADRAGRGERRR
jgi:hypothetical protein